MKKLVFFLQTVYPVSDMQAIFLDLANHMSACNKNWDVYYVNNYHDGDAKKHSSSSLKYITPDEIDESFADATFFAPVNYLSNLLSVIKDFEDAKICLLSYSDQSVDWLFGNTFQNKKAKAGVIDTLVNTHSCAYNSFPSVFVKSNVLDYSEELFIPQCAAEKLPSDVDFADVVEPGVINVAYLGDIGTPSPTNMLKNLIHNFTVQNLDAKINIHIIGNTPKIGLDVEFQEASSNFVSIIFTGVLKDPDDKRAYFKNNVDFVLAAGKNALEAAQYGVPVVIPVLDDKPFIGNNYVFLFDANEFVYQWNFLGLQKLNNSCNTLKQILGAIYNDGKKIDLAKRCFAYLEDKASLDFAAAQLEALCERSELTVQDCLALPAFAEEMQKFADYLEMNPECDFNSYVSYKKTGDHPVAQVATQKSTILKNLVSKKKKIKFLGVQRSYRKTLRRLQNLKSIKVAFLVTFKESFPARPVFEEMLKDDRFDPYIIVTPNVFRTMKYQINLYKDTFTALYSKFGDRVLNGYDIENDQYLDLGETYNIVFFANPYKHYDHPLHNVEYFLDKKVLPIYLNYGYPALKFWEEVMSLDFYNYMWKVCIENEANLKYLKEHQLINGVNGLVTGYIKADDLYNEPIVKDRRKTILICPHHTVFGWSKLNISNFLKYSDLFLRLPEMYPNIDFIFRPHPLLWTHLLSSKIWTEDKVKEYKEKINSPANMMLDETAYYFDKFMNSDAMIHDCGSFIAEYLYTKKPCCYMMKKVEQTMDTLVPFGQDCMRNHYYALSEQDILDFIDKVVLLGEDEKKQQREAFVDKEVAVNYPHAANCLIDYLKSVIHFK